MELKNGIKTFYARSRDEWRSWLTENHTAEKSLWLIIYHKASNMPGIYYDAAVEEALCFGWIDSKANKRDEESFYLFFAQRKPKSNWSKANKERAEKMIKLGLMTPAGQEMIDLAKQTGSWSALDKVESLAIPADLQKLFDKDATAKENFSAFPPSSKKMILQWILNARKAETREQRIKETVNLAAKSIKANHRV